MGQLSSLKLPTKEVQTPSGILTVRGLGTADIVLAIGDYGPQMALLFAKVQDKGTKVQNTDVKAMIMSLGQELPQLMAAIIALGCDDYSPATIKVAAKLSFPIQCELIEAIFHLTFHSEADVKKLVESLARMILGVSGALTGMKATASELGIGEFAEG